MSGAAEVATTEPAAKKLRIDASVKAAEQEAKILNKQLGKDCHSHGKNIFSIGLG